MRDDSLRLADILEAIAQIEKYTASGRAPFDREELVRVWILHHLQIIGEACRGLSATFLDTHADDIWRDAVSFRNVLAHQYTSASTSKPFGPLWNVIFPCSGPE